MIKNYIDLLVKYTLFMSDFKFLDRFSKNLQISNFIKLRPVGAELSCSMRTDRHDEADSRFSQFCEHT